MLPVMSYPPRVTGLVLACAVVVIGSASVGAQSPAASPATSPNAWPVASVAHPTGATDVILRMDTGGGLVAPPYGLTHAPEFTLYGDGTVIFRPAADPEGDGLPPFIQAAMTAPQVGDLLTYALVSGGLRDARESYQSRQVADQSTTVFTIRAGGVDKSVAVDGLGTTLPDGEDAAAYQGFQTLGVLLADFGQQVAAGHAQDPQPYQPAAYRAFLSPAMDPTAPAIPWPWPDLTLADFQPHADNEGVLVAALTPAHVASVASIPSGGVLSIAIRTPDGAPATLTIRPLLPDESA